MGLSIHRRNGEPFDLGDTALGTLHLVLGYSLPGSWKPAGRGSKQSSKMIKRLMALINKERLKELNMYSSAKQRLRKNKLNVCKYLKCVNIKKED